MKPNQIKKDNERHFLREFLLKSQLPVEKIIDGTDRDGEPDFFIILNDGSRVGVEMCRLFVDMLNDQLSIGNYFVCGKYMKHFSGLITANRNSPTSQGDWCER